jgi:hypothetical protein
MGGSVGGMGNVRNACKIVVGIPEIKRPLGCPAMAAEPIARHWAMLISEAPEEKKMHARQFR